MSAAAEFRIPTTVEARLTLPKDPQDLVALWRRLEGLLDRWRHDWRHVVGSGDAAADGNHPAHPAKMSNEAIFEAFAVALLSGNTRWDRVESVRAELGGPFLNFSPERYAALDDMAIDADLIPWFRERRAGSAGLRAGLTRLRDTARRLIDGGERDSAQHFLDAALDDARGSPEQLAMLLGTSPAWKLPGFGVALAAEALRLLGYDLCKPDRHILRAIGSWHLVRFARWEEKGAFTAPQARPVELHATMLAVRRLAEANGLGVSHANSVIWTAGAISGARATNRDFAALARGQSSS